VSKKEFMKKAILIFIIGALMVCAASAQTRKSEQTRAWKRFQTAIVRSDKTAVAAMIKFPIEASIVESELDHKIETKADFVKYYNQIFTKARRKLIARGKYEPIEDEDEFNFVIEETGGYHVFRFRKIGATYYLVGTIAVG